MSHVSKATVAFAKQILGDLPSLTVEPHTTQIPCPAHAAHNHTATLYCFPHDLAGIWECTPSGESGQHECREFETITASALTYSFDTEEIVDHSEPVTVCTACGIAEGTNHV